MSAFVGRADELRALEALVARAEEAPFAAVVVGDPGSGKTRLLGELAEGAGVEGTARIVGYEPEQNVPLSACAELLQTLASSAAGKRLSALVFETETSPLEPLRVFEAAHRAVDAFQPMLLIVDDLQWIDELSLALCHYLVRAANTSGQRLALIAAARPSAQAASFAASLAQVLPAERLASRELGPLSKEESLELVEALAPTLDPGAARAIMEKSGGSPFWLEALVRTSGAELDAAQLVTDRLRGPARTRARCSRSSPSPRVRWRSPTQPGSRVGRPSEQITRRGSSSREESPSTRRAASASPTTSSAKPPSARCRKRRAG